MIAPLWPLRIGAMLELVPSAGEGCPFIEDGQQRPDCKGNISVKAYIAEEAKLYKCPKEEGPRPMQRP